MGVSRLCFVYLVFFMVENLLRISPLNSPDGGVTLPDTRAGGGSRTRMNPLTRRVPHYSRHAGQVRQPDGDRTRPSTVTVSRAIHYTTGCICSEQYPGQDSNLERRVRGTE